jgi:hypothetical protein
MSRGTLYPQKLVITSSTSGGRSVGIVRSWTQTMEFFNGIARTCYTDHGCARAAFRKEACVLMFTAYSLRISIWIPLHCTSTTLVWSNRHGQTAGCIPWQATSLNYRMICVGMSLASWDDTPSKMHSVNIVQADLSCSVIGLEIVTRYHRYSAKGTQVQVPLGFATPKTKRQSRYSSQQV